MKIIAFVLIFTASCSPVNPSDFASFTPYPTPTTTKAPQNDNYLRFRYSSSSFGISFLIPEGWRVEENESGISLTSDPLLHVEDHLSFKEGEAIIGLRLVSQEDNIYFDESTLVDMLIHLPPYLPPGKEPAHMITVNGKRIAFAGYGINRPVPYPSYTAIIPIEQNAVLGYIFTSMANERLFRRIFQQMISSMESANTQ